MPDWRYDYRPDHTPASADKKLKDWRQQGAQPGASGGVLVWAGGVLVLVAGAVLLLVHC